MKATARAHPNIALVKYWGKRDERLILPHTGSFSVTLDGLFAETTVAFDDGPDRGELDGKPFSEKELARVKILLDAIRARAGLRGGARVVSRSNFPTAAGLASSAAGFAALALAASKAAGLPTEAKPVSILARLGSGSACRSIEGGYCEWLRGERADGDDSYAIQRFPASHWPELRLLAAECAQEAKAVSSRDAMRTTVETSPYYAGWITDATAELPRVNALVAARDLDGLGQLAERNAWRMHATSLAANPPICFLRPATLAVIERAAALRRDGVRAYFTLDAGPNPVVLCDAKDAPRVESALREAGALKVTTCAPGPDAKLLDAHLF
ncbi:MAG: diphosphomevalonate decarboxylase [Deltaproteobacteria bacterium]|nr:diphosphomevalonate decarboxylase [Deltaproteobacteria bacterium]